MAKTRILSEQLFLNFLKNVPQAGQGTYYILLLTGAPADSGTDFTKELTQGGSVGAGYARLPITAAQWTVLQASPTTAKNNALLAYPSATGNWTTVTHFAIATLAGIATGNMIIFGALTASVTVLNTDTAQWAISALTLTET